MRIFSRIFVSFWFLVIVLIWMAGVFSISLSPMPPSRYGVLPAFPLFICDLAALDEYQRGGRAALGNYLAVSTASCTSGAVIRRNRKLPYESASIASVESLSAKQFPEHASVTVDELPLRTVVAFPSGFVSHEPSFFLFMRPSRAFLLNSPLPLKSLLLLLLSRLILLIVTTGFCCYVLTLYLVRPLTRLGRMAEQLGEGDLATRIERPLAERTDELGEFSRKFNQMAGEIESLVTRHKHFLAHASHELGSPLTRVNIALALAKKKADPTLRPELDRIGHEADRLNLLVQELLLLARLESGNESSRQTTSFNIASVVDAAYADASFEATQLGKTVVILRQEYFQIIGHPELLRRSLDNVLRNGLRFAREAGVVQVEVFLSPDKGTGLISVRDDGPGISVDQQDVIFEPFVTLPDRVTGLTVGSGLGLAIARQAVLANGGKIFARNSSPGLTVTIEIPLAHPGFDPPER